jgi:hypothetical protein
MQIVFRSGLAKHVAVIGAFVIGVIVLISYHPALPIGFWYDDYSHLEMAGRPALSEFLVNIFDPRVARLWYRPFQQLQWRIEYTLWGGDALPYHVVQHLYHLLACLLLYALVARLSRNWRAGFVGALIYAVLPTYTLSVFWLGVPDPLVSIFFLLTLWLWVGYLEKGGARWFTLTFGAFVATWLTKEIAVFLPILLVLIDRWLIAKPAPWHTWIKRNAPFFGAAPIALLLGWNGVVLRLTGVDTGQADWRQLAANLMYYVTGLAFPWSNDSPIKYMILGGLTLLFVYAIFTRRFPVLLLGIFGILTLIPNLNFVGVSNRHLYLSLMASITGLGLLIEAAWNWLGARVRDLRGKYLLRAAFVLGLSTLTLWQSTITAESAVSFSTLARQSRLQFRPIFQSHPTFPPDTLLYFVEPPFTSYNVSGLMFLRYGANVSVKANDVAEYANLRQAQHAYVFYPNEQSELKELAVTPPATVMSNLRLPAQFGHSILLEGFEVVSPQAKANEAIALLMYWHATDKIDRDYTVFAHLLDDQGNILASHDSQPRRGAAPTSSWVPNALIVDAIILPVTPDTPAGKNYRIEVGVYYLPTLERLKIFVSGQTTEQDAVVFSSFAVVP